MSYLTPKEVADELKVSDDSVRRLVKRGELPANRVGKLIRISSQSLHEWLRRHEINRPEGEQPQRHAGANAPAAAHRAPLTFVRRPAADGGYQPVYGDDGAPVAASPAARRSGSARQKRRPA